VTGNTINLQALARQLIGLLDLTSLNDMDTEDSIARLCSRAVTAHGAVAAVCVWPRFVPYCREWLYGSEVRVATVVNFPGGRANQGIAMAETAAAVAYGAHEVDLVFPYRAWLAGDRQSCQALLAGCREVCGEHVLLKVILETGELPDQRTVTLMGQDAISAGADFLKTSTGKTAEGASLESSMAMLEAIRHAPRPVGFKAAGGIRTLGEAVQYMELVDSVLGSGCVTPGLFRIGASSLLDDLLKTLGEDAPAQPAAGAY